MADIVVKVVVSGSPIVIGQGPTITYGVPALTSTITLGVETGCIADFTTGLLGKGIGRVRGTVKQKGTPDAPVFRKVRLVRERDGLVIREQWSDRVTGAYDFQYVDELQTWTVISYDYLNNFRAVVADNLTLVNAGVELLS